MMRKGGSKMDKALSDLKVIDLGNQLSGSWAAMFLGDLGAEVIHIEPPGGDECRNTGPFMEKQNKNSSLHFINVNRNKQGMVLDLSKKRGKNILRDLIKVADVIIEDFAPFTMENLGFGWKAIHEINSKIIYASISAFGHDCLPEYVNVPGYDLVAQSLSGIMSITGPYGGPPSRVGTAIGDFYAAAQAVISILAALYYRTSTGRGQWHDGAKVDGLSYVLENAIVRYTIDNEIPIPLGGIHPSITPFQGYKTKDSWIIIPCGNDGLWNLLCSKIIEREDLIDHPKYKTNGLRTDHRDKLNTILDPIFKEKTTAEWLNLFQKVGHPASQINNIKEIIEDDNTKYRKLVKEIEQPEIGKVKALNSALSHMSETPGEIYAPAPQLGEHTEEVLKNILKYSEESIKKLKQEKIIG